MKTVWKYQVELNEYTSLLLPQDAEILSIQVQKGEPQLWILVNPNARIMERRSFLLVGTGHLIENENIEFIGTFQLYDGAFAGHLFEVK